MTCPVCDLETDRLTPVQAFVFGVGMGAEFGIHDTFEKMLCEKHVHECMTAMQNHTKRMKLREATT